MPQYAQSADGKITLTGGGSPTYIVMRNGEILYPDITDITPKQLLQTPTVVSYVNGGNTVIDPALGSLFVITTNTGNSTFITKSAAPLGHFVTLMINNDAGGARTTTFGSGFRMSAGTVVGTASRVSTITLIGDGTNLIEVSRMVGIV